MVNTCLHCERAPQENYLRLCASCFGVRGIQRLYRKTSSWTPERETRIQELTLRAKRRQPLFDKTIQELAS